jgi:uncharacterized repeat protein (TIGR03803 family)
LRQTVPSWGTVFRITPQDDVEIVHEFGDAGDVRIPSGLMQAANGDFYGTTSEGGPANKGTIFRMTAAGAVSVLYAFAGDSIGQYPFDSLIQAPDGSFYGLTRNDYTYSTAFRMSPDGTVALLHRFDQFVGEGLEPRLGFLRAADGNIYGTTSHGGPLGRGAVFAMTPLGEVSVVTAFSAVEDGSTPRVLIRASSGIFYGATLSGGSWNHGAAFALTADGSITWLHSFTIDEGRGITALIQASDGNLYGTTTDNGIGGGGTAFRMTTDGAVTVLHHFIAGDYGFFPTGLIEGIDGNFYGTARSAGPLAYGTVFKMTRDGELTLLHAFAGGAADGAFPEAGLVQTPDGMLYGTTTRGGTLDYGTLFSITTGGSFSLLRSVYSHDGDHSANTMPGLTLANDGNLYGVIPRGNGLDSEIFRLTQDGAFTTLKTLGSDFVPRTPPIQAPDGNLYAPGPPGSVYRLTLNGSFEFPGHSRRARRAPADIDFRRRRISTASTITARSAAARSLRLQMQMPALMTIDTPGPSQRMSHNRSGSKAGRLISHPILQAAPASMPCTCGRFPPAAPHRSSSAWPSTASAGLMSPPRSAAAGSRAPASN